MSGQPSRTILRACKRALFLAALALILCPGSTPVQAHNERLVLAFYYAWYDATFWDYDLSDQPTQTYISTDPAAIERHVLMAKQAHIDAFVQSWYGPEIVNNQTEPNFAALLDISAQHGFQATVDFEVVSPFFHSEADVVEALQYLLSVHAAHPAFLRVGGKPVIFFWRQERFSVDAWVSIRQQVDPNHTSIWIAEGVVLDHLAVFDGNHLYSVAWDPNPDAVLLRWEKRVHAYNTPTETKYWVATVMPGYDDIVTGRSDAFIRGRANGDYYRTCWDGAIQSGADWVIITSFNEWWEGSQIEPSVTYGDFYLNLTQELGDQYRASPLVPLPPPDPPTATAAPTSPPTATPTETPTPTPTATATATETSTVVPARQYLPLIAKP